MIKLNKDPINLVISGVGGQGNVIISLIIGNALVNEGYFITVGETYGVSQRGGSVMSHVKVSTGRQYSPLIPSGQADIILGMEPVETLRILDQFGNERVVTIVNPRPIHAIAMNGSDTYPDVATLIDLIAKLSAKIHIINATEEAQKIGSPILANMILIGALAKIELLPISEASLNMIIKQMFPQDIDNNIRALHLGMELV